MQRTRYHDLDWLRVIAILLLQLFHTGMFYVPWEWHIKNPMISTTLVYPMAWLHYWRMPLLLVISGAGTCFALGFRSPGVYLKERWKRLMTPLLFGMLVIVPPQIYFEHITEYGSYWEFWRTVFNFVPYPEGSFSWHHLWFILYLMLYSAVGLPLMLYLRSDRSARFRDGLVRLVSRPGGFGLFLIPLFVSQLILRPYFPETTNSLVDDWASFTYYLGFFLFGFVCCQERRLWEEILERRRGNAVIALVMIVAFFTVRAHYPDSASSAYVYFYMFTAATMAWYWILTMMGYARTLLTRDNAFLRYANEATYPFYILHQTAIITVAYYVSRSGLVSVVPSYLVVLTGSFVLSMGLYHFVIRPFGPLRFVFGMKPRPRLAAKRRAAVPQTTA